MDTNKGWQSLSYQWVKDFQFFVFILATLTLFRLLLILIYGNQASENSTFLDYSAALWMGFRVDAGTSAAIILLTFLLSITCSVLPVHQFVIKVRKYFANLFIFVAVFVLGIDIVFFGIYGDHFNQMLLGLIYDDATAIFSTIWKEHNPLFYLIVFFFVIYFLNKLMRFWLDYELNFVDKFSAVSNKFKQLAMSFLCVLLVFFSIRGGDISGAPLQLRHIFVTNDNFLNKAIINPFFALRQTIKNQLELNSKNGLSVYWNPDKLEDALNLISSNKNRISSNNIDEAIRKTAPGFQHSKPRHVFLILMESYSGWTLLPAYRQIGLSNGLKPFAEQGVHFTNFLSATRATVDSLSVLVSGLPYAGLNINYEPNALKQLPTSIAKIFNDLGYKTRFFYGGYIGWQRLDSFIKAQGFDEIYSATDIKKTTTGNEWGVDDEYMFEQIENTIEDDTPSFNFILSTSSHSPYDLDLEKLGYPISQFPSTVIAVQENAVQVMGHHWYADRELGKFLQIMKDRLENPLFAITGDHSARIRLKFPQGTDREPATVPFVLYGPTVLGDTVFNENIAGGHQDIIPTIVNLSADKGFQYPAFGVDMFDKNTHDIGVGLNQMIGSNFIVPLDRSIESVVFNGNEAIINAQEQENAINLIDAKRAISWYRIRRGNLIPDE